MDMDSDRAPHIVVAVDEAGEERSSRQRRCGPSRFVLAFEDLTYRVKTPKMKTPTTLSRPTGEVADGKKSWRGKTLLNSVSGEGREGEITAVLGASGSGKSTLIDALANRISRESLGGTVTLNGQPVDGGLLKVISAYVMQDDLLFPMLTVEETLMYSADFRLPTSLPLEKKKARVQALIDRLGLRDAAGTIIGDESHRGISGGERRRVSIGVDIVHDPIVLFLDEPMSGLDSTSAFMVVKVLQRIAHSGSIVVMSVHQPSSRILGLLDRLIFLSHGSAVFNGTPDDLYPYLSTFGRPIPENENRTEFTIDLIRDLEASPDGIGSLVEHNRSWQLTKRARPAADNSAGSSLKDAIAASISRGKLVCGAVGKAGEMETLAANPFWHEVGVLTRRAFTNTRRTPELFATRLATVLITGFVLATVYWQLDTTPRGVHERLAFFAFSVSTTFYACADTLPAFIDERHIFIRETAYNAYRRSSYVLSNALVAIPPLLVLSIAFVLVTFFAVGLAGGAHGFAFYFFITLATFWAGGSFVTFLSAVVTNVTMGYTVVVAVLAYFLLLSGFFITRDRIPDYWLWLHYLSMVKYPYEAVLRNEFDVGGRCFARGTQIFDTSPVAAAPESTKLNLLKDMSSTLRMNVTAHTCLTTGSNILHQQAITDLSKWDCLWITVAGGFIFRLLFYLSLRLGSKNKRR